MARHDLFRLTCTLSSYGLARFIANVHQLELDILPLYLCKSYFIVARYNRKKL